MKLPDSGHPCVWNAVQKHPLRTRSLVGSLIEQHDGNVNIIGGKTPRLIPGAQVD